MTDAAGYSVIDELLDDGPMEFQGKGTLTLQQGQDGPPTGPGQIRFVLRYAPGEGGERHTRAIKLSLDSVDEGGREILDWTPTVERTPLPRYDLSGTIEAGGETAPVRMEPVLVEHTLSAPMHGVFDHDITFKVRAGSGLGEDTASARAIVPNLEAPKVDTVTAGCGYGWKPYTPTPVTPLPTPRTRGRCCRPACCGPRGQKVEKTSTSPKPSTSSVGS